MSLEVSRALSCWFWFCCFVDFNFDCGWFVWWAGWLLLLCFRRFVFPVLVCIVLYRSVIKLWGYCFEIMFACCGLRVFGSLLILVCRLALVFCLLY